MAKKAAQKAAKNTEPTAVDGMPTAPPEPDAGAVKAADDQTEPVADVATEKASKAKALTEADVRRIVREEMATWRHDAAHTASQARCDQQHARDVAAGLAVTD